MRHGRRKPYTGMGVSRLPCVACGQPAVHQWQVCADGNLYRPVCLVCDAALNRMVLRFMRDPDADTKVRRYRERSTP